MKKEFVILGEPVGKQRPRFTSRGTTYTPSKTVNYENLVKLEYQSQCKGYMFPEKSMILMKVVAYFPIPQSASKKVKAAMTEARVRPTKKPDVDNILKSIADALNKIAYYDDKQIISATIEKYYSLQPRVEVTLSEVECQ